jgi:hypothetical protein
MRPVVIVGGAVVRRIDEEIVVGDQVAVGEVGQRVAELVDQRDIDVRGSGETEALFMLEPEFDLKQHAGFLLEGMVAGERDLQALVKRLAGWRLPDNLDRHARPLTWLQMFQCYNLCVNNQ